VLVLGVAATAAWFLARQKPAAPTDLPAPPSADPSADAGTSSTPPGTIPANEAPKGSATSAIAHKEGTNASTEAMAETLETEHDTYVAKRVVELQDMGMEDDPASLETILSELDNGEPTIRQAAVDAAVQFGSRDALPRLRKAASEANDAKEKSAILDAIEFLSLPTLGEALGQQNQPAPDASASTRSGR
jgi:hypothetical protein